VSNLASLSQEAAKSNFLIG